MSGDFEKADKAGVSAICFTARGLETARRIRDILPGCRIWIRMKNAPDDPEAAMVAGSLSEWTGERFSDSRLLIFVGATGIAVRSVAPFLKSKQTDPAVLCVDETASFVIPLVSGHIGGANREAALLAEGLHAIPVITTATDLNGKFAVDVFARENGLHISDMSLAKHVSAAVLRGERIPFISMFPVEGTIPRELQLQMDSTAGADGDRSRGAEGRVKARGAGGEEAAHTDVPRIRIGTGRAQRENELWLIPRIVTLGLGCRRGKSEKEMLSFIEDTLERENIAPEAVEQIATIDLKADEPAMHAAAAHFGVSLKTFDAASLAACPGHFTHSGFVNAVTGVDNVCERSALLGALTAAALETSEDGEGQETDEKEPAHSIARKHASDGKEPAHLILQKHASDGMTIAAAVREWRVCFG